jgi:hypothetical protein
MIRFRLRGVTVQTQNKDRRCRLIPFLPHAAASP